MAGTDIRISSQQQDAQLIENRFGHYYLQRTLPISRAGLGLGMFLVLSVCMIDYSIMPEPFWRKIVPYRLTVMFIPLVVAFTMTFLFRDRLWLPWMLSAIGLLVGLSTIGAGRIAASTGVEMVLWGMIFTTFNIYLILGLNLRQSMLAGWPIFLAYVGAGFYLGAPAEKFVYGCMFMAFSNLVGSYAAYRLERNAREIFATRQELELLAQTDGLTGLFNRRTFDEHLQRLWRQAKRDDRNVALFFVDVDYFKLYNDCYGHQKGDSCIQAVAAVLANSVRRPLDLVARYGGEEFAIILYDPSPEFLESFGWQLCNEVAARQIEHKASSVSPNVSVSVGCASTHTMKNDAGNFGVEQLLRSADDALYEAKSRGRNQFVIHEEMPKAPPLPALTRVAS
ncbi:MAG: diguanylate cyclase [Pseudomonadota bacterium]